MSIILLCTAALISGIFAAPQLEEPGFTFPAKLAWTFKAEEREATEYRTAIFSSAVFDDTKVYFAGSNGVLYALYKKSGEPAWSFSIEGMFSLPLKRFDENHLILASDYAVYSLNTDYGIVEWIADSASEISAGLAGEGSFVVYGTAAGDIICLDRDNGTERWRYKFTDETENAVRSSILINDRSLYCGNDAGSVVALSMDTGNKIWGFRADGSVRSGMATDNGLLFFGSEDNYVYALNLGNGTLKWKQRAAGDVNGYPVTDDEFLLITSRDRSLRIYKQSSGRPTRQSPINLNFNFSVKPLVVKGRLFFPQAKTLMARSIEQNFIMAGSYVALADITSSPIYDAGSKFIYFGCRNGDFVAIASSDVELKEPAVVDTPEVSRPNQPVPQVQDPSSSQGPGESPTKSDQQPDPESLAEPEQSGDIVENEDFIDADEADITPETALHNARLLLEQGELERAGEMWQLAIGEKAAELFTINFGLYCQESSIRSLLRTLSAEEVIIFASRRDETICYFVCIGRYPERSSAVEYKAELTERFPELPEGKIYRMDSFVP